MDITVKSKFVKSSPRKIRPVLHGLRNQNAEVALTTLKFTNRKGARLLYTLLKSAIAAAKENDLDSEKVFIKSINCTSGPRLKRRLIGSRGRSKQILKRMSHLNLTVSDIQASIQETSNKKQAISKNQETRNKQE
jgi:large subunit ribosomal protein L22